MKKMRKISVLAILLALPVLARAIPASPVPFHYIQPDGTTLELVLHGDEFFHWTTLAGSGEVVALDGAGFYRHSSLDPARREAARRMRKAANAQRLSRPVLRTHDNNPITHGERHIPVLLVEFQDLSFTLSNPASAFSRMLNQLGYSANGGTGSVRDFYYENSGGAYEPVFDVFGPVTLSGNMADYGNPDENAAYAVSEAATMLDDQIDFSRYDIDGDGYVDMIMMYYAGHNEAEGGGQNTIWPHQWWVEGRVHTELDGKTLGAYFCASEYKGSSGKNMCGIGTTTHEFGHSLGLPDFYDTDYAENGSCGALYSFSTMCSGSYNNNGRTPPYFNAEERMILGWMMPDDIPELPDGPVSLASIRHEYAYQSLTDTDGEYFLYECRDGYGWDAYIPQGLLIYHVDKSTVRNVGGATPYDRWRYGDGINAYGNHPCFYLVPAGNQSSLNFSNEPATVFPGSRNVTGYTPVDWDGRTTGTELSGISYDAPAVTFTASSENTKRLLGYVKNEKGAPLAEASILVALGAETPTGSFRFRRIVPRSASVISATTDADGCFFLHLPASTGNTVGVLIEKEGYESRHGTVSLSRRGARMDVVLYPLSDGKQAWISYIDETLDLYADGIGEYSVMGALRLSRDQLARFTGRQLNRVRFILNCSAAEAVHVIVESGDGQRLLNYPVPEPVYEEYFEVDISDAGVRIPEDRDLYVGYAVKSADYNYPLIIHYPGSGNCYMAPYSLEGGTSWIAERACDLSLSVLIGEDTVSAQGPSGEAAALARAGFNVIDPGDSFTHRSGEVFPLRLLQATGTNAPTAVSWQYDGTAVSGDSVTLTRGTHTVRALLTLSGGRRETLQLRLEVQ